MQTNQLFAIVTVIAIIAPGLGINLGYSISVGKTVTHSLTETRPQIFTSIVIITTTVSYSAANSSVLEEIIVQPVETEISQNVACGPDLGTICSTASMVPCVDISTGTTIETSYVYNHSTYSTNPDMNGSITTASISVSSTRTNVITTEYCTHL
jgi:hypothetical protein